MARNKSLQTTEKALPSELKEAVIRECQDLYQTKGLLQAEDLVERATDPASPLHSAFEWDDTIAAKRYRDVQARVLIKLVTVEISNGSEIPQYVNVRVESADGKEARGYVTLDYAMSQETLREQILKGALREARLWEQRYKDYESLKGVININKVQELEAEINI